MPQTVSQHTFEGWHLLGGSVSVLSRCVDELEVSSTIELEESLATRIGKKLHLFSVTVKCHKHPSLLNSGQCDIRQTRRCFTRKSNPQALNSATSMRSAIPYLRGGIPSESTRLDRQRSQDRSFPSCKQRGFLNRPTLSARNFEGSGNRVCVTRKLKRGP